MANDRYPLHAAERLRGAQREQAEQALSEALAQLAQAQAAVAEAERAVRAHALRGPAGALADGGPAPVVGALELQREAAFAQRRADHARALRDRARTAWQHLRACEGAVARAQEDLARARASEEAFERDHARFDAVRRREHEHAEQSEVEELLDRSRKDWGR